MSASSCTASSKGFLQSVQVLLLERVAVGQEREEGFAVH